MRSTLYGAAAAAIAAVALLLPFVSPGAEAEDHSVTVGDNFFSPSTLNIVAGDTVNWTLSSGVHTIVADDGSFDSGVLGAGGFSQTFNTPGTYEYFCSVHSSADLNLMNGTIVVAAGTQPTNTPAPPTNTPQPEASNTPAAGPTNTPAAAPTATSGAGNAASPTPVEADPIAASATPEGGAGGGSSLPGTGMGDDAGAGGGSPAVWLVAVLVAGVVAIAAAAGGLLLRRKRA